MATEQKQTLADLGDTTNPFWLKCDIDGRGLRWRLARFVEMRDEDGISDGVQIMSEDVDEIDHFEDYAENYQEREAVEILPPQE
jgi:hypothetical protein